MLNSLMNTQSSLIHAIQTSQAAQRMIHARELKSFQSEAPSTPNQRPLSMLVPTPQGHLEALDNQTLLLILASTLHLI